MASPDTRGASALTRRRTLTVLMFVLLVALIAQIVMLILLPSPGSDDVSAVRTVAGVRTVQVIYGPGVGKAPFFDSPMGVAYAPDGTMYVADTGNDRIVVFDSEGRFKFEFGGFGVAKPAAGAAKTWQPGLMNYPTDVAVGDDGSVYVADFRNDQIQVFDPQGRFLRAFPDAKTRIGKGTSGQGGKGIAVTSLTVVGDRIYANDRHQVVTFSTDGEFISQFGRPGTGEGYLDHPNGIAVTDDGTLVVSDSGNNRVMGLSTDGAYKWTVGRPYGIEDTPNTEAPFAVPRGMSRLPDDELIVVDAALSRLFVMSSGGEVLARYGREGLAPGQFYFPVDLAVLGDLVAVAEKGSDRVQVVRLLGSK